MTGRESKQENDLFFVCSLIEQTARITKNKRGDIVKKLGEAEIARLLELADILHCIPIDITANELIERYNIATGTFDNVAMCMYSIPTHFDIAKVYKRLISSVSANSDIGPVKALIEVYTSWISEIVDNYNSSMYYENPQYIYMSYISGTVLP